MFIELVPVDDLKIPVRVELGAILPVYSEILRSSVVERPTVADPTSRVVLHGHELWHALQLLSAKRAPVYWKDISEVAIEGIAAEDLERAGLEGPKLPPGGLKVELGEVPRVRISLDELGIRRDLDRDRLKVYNDTLELLYKGWPTPLVRLRSMCTGRRSVWAKLEFYNPFSNSIKDRVGWYMIKEALEEGELGEVLYEATSTNTGIALASIASVLGRKARLYLPQVVQRASDTLLRALGADVVRTSAGLTVEVIKRVEEEARAAGAVHLNQFENDANFKVHLKYTAREIDEQLESVGPRPTHIIGGLGTSGHMSA